MMRPSTTLFKFAFSAPFSGIDICVSRSSVVSVQTLFRADGRGSSARVSIKPSILAYPCPAHSIPFCVITCCNYTATIRFSTRTAHVV